VLKRLPHPPSPSPQQLCRMLQTALHPLSRPCPDLEGREFLGGVLQLLAQFVDFVFLEEAGRGGTMRIRRLTAPWGEVGSAVVGYVFHGLRLLI